MIIVQEKNEFKETKKFSIDDLRKKINNFKGLSIFKAYTTTSIGYFEGCTWDNFKLTCTNTDFILNGKSGAFFRVIYSNIKYIDITTTSLRIYFMNNTSAELTFTSREILVNFENS